MNKRREKWARLSPKGMREEERWRKTARQWEVFGQQNLSPIKEKVEELVNTSQSE